MTVSYPDRLELAQTPTPLCYADRTSNLLGVEIWFKRDDLTGCALSGNKVRKLEFLLADAKNRGATTLITCGGEQSNHCRATAVAAAGLGLRCVLFLRTHDPQNPPAATANILLDRLVGADVRWISHDQWQHRGALMETAAATLAGTGQRAYVIPEGGSSAMGSWGYVRAAEEIASDLARLPVVKTSIVYACGSGGTGAGLILGKKLGKLSGAPVKIIGINVCDDRSYFVETIGRIAHEFADQFGATVNVNAGDIDIVDGYVGLGYAKSQPQELDDIVSLAQREGVILDPVYGGKAWHGLLCELKQRREHFGERIVFVHTGGIFGLFPVADALMERIK